MTEHIDQHLKELDDAALICDIEKIQQTHPTYGLRKIAKELGVGYKRIRRLTDIIKHTDTVAAVQQAFLTNPDIAIDEISDQTGVPPQNVRVILAKLNMYTGDDIKERIQQTKERLRKQISSRLDEQQTRKISMYEIVKEDVTQAIRDTPKVIPYTPYPLNVNAKEDLVLVLSDLQIGEIVSPTITSGLGEYNISIFMERTMSYLDNLDKAINEFNHGYNRYRRCWILLNGDIVEGRTIFKGQSFSSETITKQVMTAVKQLSYMIGWIANHFPQVVIVATVGNHGRVAGKGEFPLVEDNLDYLVYKMVETYLEHMPHIQWNIPQSYFCGFEICGYTFAMTHGDQIKSWAGIPFYGAQRHASRTVVLFKQDIYKEILGHHHEPAQFGMTIMNGNWVGTNEFSAHQLATGGLPSQKVFAVREHYGVTWSTDILLVDPDEYGKMIISKPYMVETADT